MSFFHYLGQWGLSFIGFPNKFGTDQKLCSEAHNFLQTKRATFTKINVFHSKKIRFEPFLWTARHENGFLSNFSPISNNLLNRLLHKIIGEKLLQNSIFIFTVHRKGSKCNFWNEIYIYVKVSGFARKLFWASGHCI